MRVDAPGRFQTNTEALWIMPEPEKKPKTMPAHRVMGAPYSHRPQASEQPKAPPAAPKLGVDPAQPLAPATAQAPLELLLKIEELAREAADVTELRHLIVNQTRKLIRARQIFLLLCNAKGYSKVVCVSGMSSIDATSILLTEVAVLVRNLARENGLGTPIEFTLPAFCAQKSDLAAAYPFREMAWVPLAPRKGVPFAGMLMARENVWSSSDIAIARRLGATYAHAWRELQPVGKLGWLKSRAVLWHTPLALLAAIAMFIPVPMTALAPIEIVAASPVIVAAPLDGVVEAIDVDPNSPVKAGDVILRFSDTMLRNKRDIAVHEVAVAQARVRQLNLLAFGDAKGRQELGLAEAELELKKAELAYANDLLDKSTLKAQRDGIAIYPDRKALIGKPVATGERLMEIADPARIEARIDVAVADVIALRKGGTARLFLDVDPLNWLTGRIVRADYKARPSDSDVLAFKAFVEIDGAASVLPRIGLRGTAQIQADSAPLGIVLFRRPISAARQWLGL